MFGLPLVFMLVSSLKPDIQIFGDLTSVKAFLPVGDISLDNYTAVFNRVPFWRFLMNSIMISALTVTLGLIVNSMCCVRVGPPEVPRPEGAPRRSSSPP